jgi:hypothetical protein
MRNAPNVRTSDQDSTETLRAEYLEQHQLPRQGRFQDRDYCASAVMDQIVADGKSAILVLISQITDSRWIAETVYDYSLRIRTGELAHFIL